MNFALKSAIWNYKRNVDSRRKKYSCQHQNKLTRVISTINCNTKWNMNNGKSTENMKIHAWLLSKRLHCHLEQLRHMCYWLQVENPLVLHGTSISCIRTPELQFCKLWQNNIWWPSKLAIDHFYGLGNNISMNLHADNFISKPRKFWKELSICTWKDQCSHLILAASYH